MTRTKNLRIAIQKSGRLHKKSVDLLEKSGIQFEWQKNGLIAPSYNYPIEAMLVRDDDIPEYVQNNIADLGIVGLNVLEEANLESSNTPSTEVIKLLGFGSCKLSLCIPEDKEYKGLNVFQNSTIATSYPGITKNFLKSKGIDAQIININGSVEISPKIGVSDFICDLVSTGATLQANGLKECEVILKSQSVLVKNKNISSPEKEKNLNRLLNRIDGVIKANNAKYIMMNAPREKISEIVESIPGLETPSIIPIGNNDKLVAIHAVASENIFWETIEKLKENGASSILVVPIEKIID